MTGSPSRGAGGAGWSELTHAAAELDAVAGLLAVAHAEVAVRRGADATETAVVEAVAGRGLLHFATHGFFESSDAQRQFAAALGRLARHPGEAETAPLRVPALGTTAGIVLAPTGADDGILTAAELAWLDLSACRLVVLSACETALGTELNGEHLLGLRRSLRLAGARASLTNLWRVDDDAACALIERFYRHLLLDRHPPAAALREAQLEILMRCRAERGDAAPGVWGGWLLEGR